MSDKTEPKKEITAKAADVEALRKRRVRRAARPARKSW